jgi:hypothetical protein
MSEKKARPNFENLVEKASAFLTNFEENFQALDLEKKKAMTIADFLRSDSVTKFICTCKEKGLDHNKTRVALNKAIGYAIRPAAFNARAKELGFEIKPLGISRQKESRGEVRKKTVQEEITPVAIAPGEKENFASGITRSREV